MSGTLSSMPMRIRTPPPATRPSAAPAPAVFLAGAPPRLSPHPEPAAVEAHIAERVAESDARAAEVERLQPSLNEVSARLTAARTRVAEATTRLTQLKNEHATLEERAKRQVGTRAAGVEDAQKAVRKALVEFGRRAMENAHSFGPELSSALREAKDLGRSHREGSSSVALHEAALASYDPKILRRGLVVGGAALLLFVAILFGPLGYRSCVGVEAPPLHPTQE